MRAVEPRGRQPRRRHPCGQRRATRCAHQLLHPLPLPTLPTCYCLNSAQRSRLSRCCRVAQPTDPGWPSLARLAADARMRCRLPGPSRQLRQADCLKPSFLLAPNRSADDQCQGCPQGITRDARSAPLTVTFCGSILGRREGCPTSSACPVGPGLGHGRPRWSAWLLTAPTLPWPEGPKAARGARRGTDRRSGPALAAPYGCPGIPAPGSSAVGRLGGSAPWGAPLHSRCSRLECLKSNSQRSKAPIRRQDACDRWRRAWAGYPGPGSPASNRAFVARQS